MIPLWIILIVKGGGIRPFETLATSCAGFRFQKGAKSYPEFYREKIS